jgi:tetratricopeptide (TPR) repeat protein
MGFTPPHEAGPKTKAAALQAIALDDSSAIAHARLAGVRTWTDWDWAGAEPEWRRALQIDPNLASAHAYFAHFLAITGRIDEAIPHSERAIELDPFNALFHGLYSMVLCGVRRYDDALVAHRTAQAMQPGLPVSAVDSILFAKGMRAELLAHHREDHFARDPEGLAALEQGLEEAGYEGAQRHIADLMAARYERSSGVPDPNSRPWNVAYYYLYAGEYDRTMDWLEEAFEFRDPSLPYLFYPEYDPLRSDPRFQDLLRRMNLPTTSAGSDPDQQR